MRDRLRIRLPAANGRPVITLTGTEEITTSLGATDARYATIEGLPGVFCEGLDLAGLAEPAAEVRTAQQSYAAMLRAIERSPCPVVALVDGVALGGGLGLAAAADLVIATPASTFGLPEVLVGLIPAVALPVIAQRVGPARARLLALDGGTIDAAAAAAIGLVDEVTDDLEQALARHAKRLLRMDRAAQREVKQIAARMAAPDADTDALRRFAALYDTAGTRARIARMAAGEPPWLDNTEIDRTEIDNTEVEEAS
ncbi:enoyl-CoA hydratase-related protein [Actinokineospora sp.]|uniref:enoyl-CoA hydratase-related protein n=1 Tax=Actinokineospora sp. TaxID=1872133 RepID=UPI0040379E54